MLCEAMKLQRVEKILSNRSKKASGSERKTTGCDPGQKGEKNEDGVVGRGGGGGENVVTGRCFDEGECVGAGVISRGGLACHK